MLGFALCYAILAGRALWVQGVASTFYVQEGQKRYGRVEQLLPQRGEIVDRSGKVLALNMPLAQVWVDPEEIIGVSPVMRSRLAKALGLKLTLLDRKLIEHGRFVILKNYVARENADLVSSMRLPGVHVTPQWRRFYPEDEMAQIVGFVGRGGAGQEGVELFSDAVLAGEAGVRKGIADRLGRQVEDVSVSSADDGASVCLSVDSRIQSLSSQTIRQAVQQHRAHSGGVVVLNAHTGELLALANWPSFDPNDRASFVRGVLRNGVVADEFEPGSTIKPITMALALDRGVVREDTVIDASGGSMRIGSNVIHDTADHGHLNVLQILQKSSNVGMARIALKLRAQDMAGFFSNVGFGRRPDLPLPAVTAGRLRPWRRWLPVEQATMAYGYGLSISLLQLAQSYTAFANDGAFVPATLGCLPVVPTSAQIIKPATAAAIRRALELTVSGGTARQAAIEGYRVGGKTGTTRKQEGHGYAKGKYRATFVGMAPMGNPQIIVAVMIDEPRDGAVYGGTVAAPVFAAVMKETLRLQQILPDRLTSSVHATVKK